MKIHQLLIITTIYHCFRYAGRPYFAFMISIDKRLTRMRTASLTFKFLLYRLLQSETLYALCLWAIILLWGYTGLVKLLDFESSHRAMRNQVFGNQAADVLAWLVPLAELLAAGLIAFACSRFAGLILSFMLMASFTVYILFVINNRFGRIPCSCGGVIQALSWEQHLLLNCFYLLIIIYALLRHRLLFYAHGLTYQRKEVKGK